MEIVREALLLAQTVAQQLGHAVLLNKINAALKELNNLERKPSNVGIASTSVQEWEE